MSNCLIIKILVYKYLLRPDLKWQSVLTNLSDRGRWFQRTDAALTKLLSPPVVRTVLGSRSVIAFWVDQRPLCPMYTTGSSLRYSDPFPNNGL